MTRLHLTAGVLAMVLAAAAPSARAASAPHLARQGSADQLIVDDKPFLILGGELANSSPSDLDAIRSQWARFSRLHLNTVLAPVSWELIEPEEGRFDFASVDGLLHDARAADLHLVLLWFGSWKNSMSTYAPSWVKRDQARFPRTRRANGRSSEILSPLSRDNLEADARAYAALMAHLKAVDGERHTVVMIQVENEMGMLPDARDMSPAADAAFARPVPGELISWLKAHPGAGAPELKAPQGDWRRVFGPSPTAEEAFTAWTLARYADAVARAGKQAYDLPMYANVALNRPGREPGDYPSGGPLPHVIEVWKAGAPSLAFLAPDIYFPNFGEIVERYRRADNPLFIPEAGRAGRAETPSEAFLAFGGFDALGVSPFAIDEVADAAAAPLASAYDVLSQLSPLILANQGLGHMAGFRPKVSYDGTVSDEPQTVRLGDYSLTADFVWPWSAKSGQKIETHGALAIQLGPDAYLVAGSGVTFSFAPAGPCPAQAGFERVEEGRYVAGRWVAGRRLNGDETHQGRKVMLPPDAWSIQRVTLYRYD
jgi:beta-galactosidase GanA